MKIKIAVLLIIIGLIYFVFDTLKTAGFFYEVIPTKNHYEEVIITPPGVEDITITGDLALFSSHDRRKQNSTGDIFRLNLNDNSYTNLTKNLNLNQFRPHGISFLQMPNGERLLFVISHSDKKNEILKFAVVADTLQYLSKYNSTEFISPNDILAVGNNQFFITNDHSRKKDWIRTIGDYVKFPSGNVVYFDGERAKVVADKIPYANGINISKDKKYIFVASTTTNKLLVFRPELENKGLRLIETFKLSISPDNIEIDSTGNLLIGCHPHLLDFAAHSKDKNKKSPSAILKVNIKSESMNFEESLIYQNNGTSLSGSSVAAPYKNNIYLGSVFENKIIKIREKM